MSTERIDHAQEARAWVGTKGASRADVPPDLTSALASIAQVHATLALVEQQRIANLIALGQFRVAPGDVAHFRHLVAQPTDEYSLTVSPQISEALGLS